MLEITLTDLFSRDHDAGLVPPLKNISALECQALEFYNKIELYEKKVIALVSKSQNVKPNAVFYLSKKERVILPFYNLLSILDKTRIRIFHLLIFHPLLTQISQGQAFYTCPRQKSFIMFCECM